MTEIHLVLPTRGPFDLLERVARGVDLAGLAGLYAPFDPDGLESLVVAAGALRATRYALAAAEFSPGVATPVYAAKFSASLQRFSGGRFGWHLTGAAPDVTEEFLTIAKGVWNEPDFSHEGRHFSVLKGGLGPVLAAGPFPRVLLSGTSAAELELSARHADVHVFDAADDVEALRPDGVTAALRVTADELDDHLGRAEIYFVTSEEPLRDAYRIGAARVG